MPAGPIDLNPGRAHPLPALDRSHSTSSCHGSVVVAPPSLNSTSSPADHDAAYGTTTAPAGSMREVCAAVRANEDHARYADGQDVSHAGMQVVRLPDLVVGRQASGIDQLTHSSCAVSRPEVAGHNIITSRRGTPTKAARAAAFSFPPCRAAAPTRRSKLGP